jgi:hypothetical protein
MRKEANECNKEHIKQLCAAHYTLTQEDKNDAAAHTVHLLAGSVTSNEKEPDTRIHIREAIMIWITYIKHSYKGHVIQWTVKSTTFDRKKINDTLIPYKIVIIPVQLNEKELEINNSVLLSLLKLHNIDALIIHGGHGAEERNKTVLQFHSDPKVWVLIFSSVGAIGLNLTMATVVVLFVSFHSLSLHNTCILLKLTNLTNLIYRTNAGHACWSTKSLSVHGDLASKRRSSSTTWCHWGQLTC